MEYLCLLRRSAYEKITSEGIIKKINIESLCLIEYSRIKW